MPDVSFCGGRMPSVKPFWPLSSAVSLMNLGQGSESPQFCPFCLLLGASLPTNSIHSASWLGQISAVNHSACSGWKYPSEILDYEVYSPHFSSLIRIKMAFGVHLSYFYVFLYWFGTQVWKTKVHNSVA